MAGPGAFTSPGDLDVLGGVSGGGPSAQSAAACPPGSFCPGDGTARLCPGGTYGAVAGLATANCSGLCAAGFYCPAGSVSATARPCHHQRPDSEAANVFCPPGSRAPVPTRLGYYSVRAGDPRYGGPVGGYRGDVATIGLAFNFSASGSPATSGRLAVLRAAISDALGLRDEASIGRFAVLPLRATTLAGAGVGARDLSSAGASGGDEAESAVWAVRLEVTAAFSDHGSGSADAWRDRLRAKLSSPAASALLGARLGHLPGNGLAAAQRKATNTTTAGNSSSSSSSSSKLPGAGTVAGEAVVIPGSVRAVVAARRPQAGEAFGSDPRLPAARAFDSSDPSRYFHESHPLEVRFNISATVAGLDDAACVLSSAQVAALRRAVVAAIGADPDAEDADGTNGDGDDIGGGDGEEGVLRVRNFGVSTARRTRRHGRARGHNGTLLSGGGTGLDPAANTGGGTWSVEVVWAVGLSFSYPRALVGRDDRPYSDDAAAWTPQAHDRQDRPLAPRAWGNDAPGPLGWRGNSGGPRDGDAAALAGFWPDQGGGQPFGLGDGTGGGGGGATAEARAGSRGGAGAGRSSTLVDPAERWAAAVHSALSGERFQAAAERALALPAVTETPHRVVGPAAVTVHAESVSALPAGGFGWVTAALLEDVHDGGGGGGDPSEVSGVARDNGGREWAAPQWGNNDGSGLGHDDANEVNDANGRVQALGSRGALAFRDGVRFGASGGFALEFPCEAGHFCVNGMRFACPAGRYGARGQSTDPRCDGPCAAGYYCPAGSTDATARVCGPKGDASVFCPPGSSRPTPVSLGHYTYGDTAGGKRGAQPFGLVDADRDGLLTWLEFSASGPVREASLAKAVEAFARRDVSHGAGVGGVAGTSGLGGALGAASSPTVIAVPGLYGVAPAAAYEADVDPRARLVEGGEPAHGLGADPDGDAARRRVIEDALRVESRNLWALADRDGSGELDPREYRAVVLALGPWGSAGTGGAFGDGTGRRLSGSGPSFFVPSLGQDGGSSHHPRGYPGNETAHGDRRLSLGTVETRTHQAPCEPGHYCVAGVRHKCPRGVFGAASGLSTAACSGPCRAGHFCPEESTGDRGESATTVAERGIMECGGSHVFCPPGSRSPQPVLKGHFTEGGKWDGRTRSSERRCGPGSYCNARGERLPCRAGFYGDAFGLVDPKCSGLCAAGFFCPVGSSKAEEFPCGDPGVYCPEGSALPLPAPAGEYTVNGVCEDAWPAQLRSETAFDNAFLRPGEPVFTAADLATVLAHEAWAPGKTWTVQATVTSTCPSPLRFGFAFGEGTLLFTVPPGAVDVTLRTFGEVSVVRSPRSTYFQAFDQCVDTNFDANGTAVATARTEVAANASVTFHELRLGAGRCPGFRAPPLGRCVEARWTDADVAFEAPRNAEAIRAEDTAHPRTADVSYLARSVALVAPDAGVVPLLRVDRGLPMPDGRASVPAGLLANRTWTPCDFARDGGGGGSGGDGAPPSADGIAAGRRLLYDDGPYAVWVSGEPVWWRSALADALRATPSALDAASAQLAMAWPSAAYSSSPWSTYASAGSDEGHGEGYGEGVAPPAGVAVPGATSTLGAGRAVGGAARRTATSLSPRGHYAAKGLLYECPAGQFGAVRGLGPGRECSGACEEGFFCPPASVHPRQFPCGATDRFCPAGAPHPLPVSKGFYTSVVETEACPPGLWRNLTLLSDPTTEVGTNPQTAEHLRTAAWGPTVAHWRSWGGDGAGNGPSLGNGEGPGDGWAVGPLAPCVPCPEGTFKATTGDGLDECRPCDLTVSESTDDRASCRCLRRPGGEPFDFLIFVAANGTCEAVTAEAFATHVTAPSLRNSTVTRFREHPCERGFACPPSGVRQACPAGRYGASVHNTDPQCDGPCAAGYVCPEGSVTATQFPCGGADRFCPKGSAQPLFVRTGWFTNEDAHELVRSSEAPCPAGYWCAGGERFPCPPGTWGKGGGAAASQAESCAACDAGFFCPHEAHTDPRPFRCGNASVFCPTGSARPTAVVAMGFYTTHASGLYEGALALADPRNETMSAQLLCEPGYWCRGGVKYQCPAGTFGWAHGDSDPGCGGPCAAGFRCPGHPGPPSTVANPLPCASGSLHAHQASSFYCPAGTGNAPRRVDSGFYTVGGGRDGNTTRTNQVRCEQGWWCSGGVKQPCPAGSYGRARGLTTARCSGVCPKGFACPEASVLPTKCAPGTYSTGAAKRCTPCPGNPTDYRRDSQSCVDARSCCGF